MIILQPSIMNKVLLLFLITFSTNNINRLSARCYITNDTAIIGKWQSTEDKDRILEIYKRVDGFYYGKSVEGKLILKELKYDSVKNSFSGKIQPTEARKTLNATITVESHVKIKIVATNLFVKKTVYFNKIN